MSVIPEDRVAICMPESQVIRRYAIYRNGEGTLYVRVGVGYELLDSLADFVRLEHSVPKMDFRVSLEQVF